MEKQEYSCNIEKIIDTMEELTYEQMESLELEGRCSTFEFDCKKCEIDFKKRLSTLNK